MTASTGQRSYRACVRCRQRKRRCNLVGIGEPKRPPCVTCYESGSECILAKSRRGGDFRHYRPGRQTGTADARGSSTRQSNTATCPTGDQSYDDDGSGSVDDSSDVLAMELRNPSDALQILALSDTSPNGADTVQSSADAANAPERRNQSRPTAFDDYELVQKGILRPSLISELLLKYARCYHPYCPIVPSYLLRSQRAIQKSDHFLLTAILTIASRDDPSHSQTHRDCWDHTQRLLVDVLLAHHWTQTPRTVEGLLLLAEWLPHIQIQGTSEAPKNLFSEDRTAWSLVGLAVRQGYLQRLDQGAFPINRSESKDLADQSRLVWAYIFMADRQISVRLGQSFWSRGPSLAAKFTAQDFPTLQPHPDNVNEDYASVLQASMELVQILHNAHAILYSSKERTLAMVYEGYYARYLDDFRIAAKTWYAKWSELQVCPMVRSTLLIMYEYISLYTNAFSFQAVLTRASDPRTSTATAHRQRNKWLFTGLLSGGIMASPDGRFIFDAISAAMNLLTLMNGLDPHQVICYLPSRYYLYGVYAAVLLRKADCAGAFQSPDQREEVTSLAREFVSSLEKAPSTETHICHSYSRMLKQLWSSRERRTNHDAPARTSTDVNGPQSSMDTPQQSISPTNNQTASPDTERLAPSRLFDVLPEDHGTAPFASIDGYLFGSFMPGVADFSTLGFGETFNQPSPFSGSFQDWGLYQDGADYGCPP